SFVRRMCVNPQTVVTMAESLTAVKYSWVASLAFMLYDHVITLAVEVVNVWNHPRSLSKWCPCILLRSRQGNIKGGALKSFMLFMIATNTFSMAWLVSFCNR
ncbi:hypothetical protein JB92DRAFT_2958537, partial [Gautieria morchelliformis]